VRLFNKIEKLHQKTLASCCSLCLHLEHNFSMEFLLVGAYCLVFVWIIRRSDFYRIKSPFPVWIFFLLKCLAGISLGLIYTHYYVNHTDADTFKFFTDSQYIFDRLWDRPYDFFRMFTGIHGSDPDLRQYYVKMDSWLNTSPLYNDNRTMIRLNTLFRFFSFGHYYVHVVFINFISFTGIICLYKTFKDYLTGKKTELLLLLFLMPSLLFWGSGMLKDGLLITFAGTMLLSFERLIRFGITKKRLLIFLFSLFVLSFIKVYVTVLMLPGLFAWFLTRRKNSRVVVLTFAGIYLTFFVVAFNLYHFKDEYNVAALLFYKQKNFIEIGIQHSAKMLPAVNYECSGPSILANTPKAISNVLFRPFIWETKGNPMMLLSAFENLFILTLIIIFILTLNIRQKMSPIVMHSIIFVFSLFALIGLITPVLGAIVRYRIIGLPFLIFFLLYYYDKERMKKLIGRFKKL
jgi:hypothetical protein